MSNQTKLELLSFGNLLGTEFNPLNIVITFKTKTIDILRQEIDAEMTRIINEIKNVTCRGYEEYHVERYIQMHQREAINLMDITGKYLKELDRELLGENVIEQAFSLYQAVIIALENILNYIEKDQCKYFDLNMAVPDSYRIGSAELLNTNLNVLKAKLKSKATDPALQELILEYFSNHCLKTSCSYQQLIYAKLTMNNLLWVLSVNKDIDWDKKIILSLIYLNFNNSTFFRFCQRYIALSVAAESGFTAQAGKFSWYIKEIKKLQLKPNVACKQGRTSISDLLLDYITLEQLHILEVQNQSHEKQPVKEPNERASKFDFKLALNLTVDQLALFLELFIRINIFAIEKGKIMTTIHFFTKYVTTIGTGCISALSLNKSRKPSPRTIEWMKETLKCMRKALDDMERE